MTWPRNVGQVPLFYARALSHEPRNVDRRYWNEDGAPLYAFGHALSYTTFWISEPQLMRKKVRIGESVEVAVDVSNTGDIAGDEVVQLYVHQRAGRAIRPVRELKGFQRVTLMPREKKTVRFTLRAEDLKYWSFADSMWVSDLSLFDVWVSSSSAGGSRSEFEVIRRYKSNV